MKTKHTQGEWKIGNLNERKNTIEVVAYPNGILTGIANIFNGFSTRQSEAEANAKLIASAPELLDALKKVLEFVPKMEQLATWERAEQAIKKATE